MLIGDGVLANDKGTGLNAALATAPTHGSVVLNPGGSFTYTPNPNYSGPDSFTYTATDSSAQVSNAATVTLAVTPVANDDAYSVPTGSSLLAPASGVPANDKGKGLTAAFIAGTNHGVINLNADGSFKYTPTGGYVGPDSFTYRAIDDSAQGSPPATVAITVTAVNHAPTANDDPYTVDANATLTIDSPGVLENDNDADGDTLTAIKVTNPSHGTVTLNANGSFTYTPNAGFSGHDSFTYKANDGTADSNVATVNLTVKPVANDDSYSTAAETPLTIDAPGVLGNDEGATLSAILVANATDGNVALNADGSFTYTPNAGFTGTDSFTYKANDGSNDSNVATVTIDVVPAGSADLSLTKSASPDPVPVGGDVTYTLTAKNNGPDTATGVLVTDFLPFNGTFVSAT